MAIPVIRRTGKVRALSPRKRKNAHITDLQEKEWNTGRVRSRPQRVL